MIKKTVKIKFEKIATLEKFKNFKKKKVNPVHKKNIKEVYREYEQEEWAGLFSKIKKLKLNNVHITDIDKIYNNFCDKNFFFDDGFFYYGNNKYILNKYNAIYIKTISKFLKKNNNSIVELGAGYGSKIFNLAKSLKKKSTFFAGEYSANGRKIMSLINKKNMISKIFKCNLLDKELTEPIPKNSIIFTSYALHYTPKIKKNFYLYFKKANPKVIIHFEPFFEVHDYRKVYGKMCKNYIAYNDYCKNQLSTFKKLDKEKKIKILFLKKNIFGSNPLLPISILAWKFK
tara:strand:+ start:6654 stop:7514 length:861 start_codon:yes stop_codon:yes gene_type:complete